jgi:hypothetical protein
MGSSFCEGGFSSAFELGGIGEPFVVFNVSLKHALTTSRIPARLEYLK